MSSIRTGSETPPKGIICYYSGSGNTKLACRYIQSKIKSVQFDLFNIDRDCAPDLHACDVVGFATFTDFLDPPQLFHTFLARLPGQNKKPAFVFNTYGFINGKTLETLDRLVRARGFRVLAGHSLHMPESNPPMVAGGRANEQAPSEKELAAFNRFIRQLDHSIVLLQQGNEVKRDKTIAGRLADLLPPFSRTWSRRDMGTKYVDSALCKECGACAKLCPYGAIKMGPKPIFDQAKCFGCWRCFNLCPNKAIYTKKYRGVGHYPKPMDVLREKLKA
jgi:ferredoxin